MEILSKRFICKYIPASRDFESCVSSCISRAILTLLAVCVHIATALRGISSQTMRFDRARIPSMPQEDLRAAISRTSTSEFWSKGLSQLRQLSYKFGNLLFPSSFPPPPRGVGALRASTEESTERADVVELTRATSRWGETHHQSTRQVNMVKRGNAGLFSRGNEHDLSSSSSTTRSVCPLHR